MAKDDCELLGSFCHTLIGVSVDDSAFLMDAIWEFVMWLKVIILEGDQRKSLCRNTSEALDGSRLDFDVSITGEL